MNNRRRPTYDKRTKICIICEGNEEERYINRLKELRVWNDDYNVTVRNAGSIDKIASEYEYAFSSVNYDIVLIMCNTEIPPYEKFIALKEKIDAFHDAAVSDKIIFYANPCTMQLILSHFADIRLKTNNKSAIARDYLKKYCGLTEYRAREKELDAIMRKLTKENYCVMRKNLRNVPTTCDSMPGTNFLCLLAFLSDESHTWIDDINDLL